MNDNIPEGATHESGQNFYKILDSDVYIYDDLKDVWHLTFMGSHWAYKNLPPLQSTQWLPEVGQECEYPSGQGVVRLPPDSNGVLIVEEGGVYKRVAASECKPLKTEREKFIDECFGFANEMDFYDEKLTRLLEVIFDYGDKFFNEK